MKAIVVTDQAAGTAGMKLVERPEPRAAINDVIVQTHASGFVPTEMAWPSTWNLIAATVTEHHLDPRPRAGRSGHRSRLRHDGTVGGTASVRPRRLVSRRHPGGVCSHRGTQPLAPLPGDVDFTVGASLPISGLTAWQGLFQHGRLRAGQSVLAHGAAGAVGSMVTQRRARPAPTLSAPDARPTVRRRSTSARRSSLTSTTTRWKASAASIWHSMSSAATSRSGPQA